MKMKKIVLAMSLLLLWATQGWAVPVLQIGAPAEDSISGVYDDYSASLTDPTETDTALITGNTLVVAGVYQKDTIVSLGGQYSGGDDWTDFGLPADFSGRGAILIATVPEAQLATGTIELVINGVTISSFYQSTTNDVIQDAGLNGLANHAPTGADTSGYLFFDIGEFSKLVGTIVDFETETGSADGSIITMALDIDGFDWVHFDVMALETEVTTNGNKTKIDATVESNPFSHDVTWKDDGGGPDPQAVPEPGTIILVGFGLVGLAILRKKK